MSQIRKVQTLQTGGPVKYKFRINKQDVDLEDGDLNSSFDSAFNTLVAGGYAKSNDKDKWKMTYETWKNQAKNGIYDIDLDGDDVKSMSYTGEALSDQNKGYNESGTLAKSNVIGRVIGGVDDTDKQMALLNTALGANIGKVGLNKISTKEQEIVAAKAKVETEKAAAEAKAKAESEAAANTTNPADTPSVTPATKPAPTTPVQKPTYQFDKNKSLLFGGKPYTGIYVNNDENDHEYAYQSSATGHYLNGKKVDKQALEQFLQSSEDKSLLKKYQDDLTSHRNTFDKLLSKYTRLDRVETGDNFTFNDIKDRANLRAREVSNMFSKLRSDNFRLYSYTNNERTNLDLPKMNHRIVLPDGRIRDGRIKRATDGTYRFHFKSTADGKGYNIDLGALGEGSDKVDPFYLPNAIRRKEGGIIKAQMGAIIKNAKTPQEDKFKSASAADFGESIKNDNYKLSDADKASLVGLSADLASLGLSFTGVGSVGAGVTGAVGTTANLVSDIKRDGFDLGDVGNAALGYGLDALTAIPGLGLGAKTGKMVSVLRTANKWLAPALMAAGAVNGAKALSKINEPSKMTIDDWRAITLGVQGLVSGKRVIDNIVATKTTGTKTIKANGQRHPLTPEAESKINSAKTTEEKVQVAKEYIANKLKKPVDEIDLNLKVTNKAKVAGTLGLIKPKTDLDIRTVTTGLELKNPTGANRYITRAIENTAVLNPHMKGADALGMKNAQITNKGDIKVDSGLDLLGNRFRSDKSKVTVREAIDTKLSAEPIDADVKQWQKYSPMAEPRPEGFNVTNFRSNNMNKSEQPVITNTETAPISKENGTSEAKVVPMFAKAVETQAVEDAPKGKLSKIGKSLTDSFNKLRGKKEVDKKQQGGILAGLKAGLTIDEIKKQQLKDTNSAFKSNFIKPLSSFNAPTLAKPLDSKPAIPNTVSSLNINTNKTNPVKPTITNTNVGQSATKPLVNKPITKKTGNSNKATRLAPLNKVNTLGVRGEAGEMLGANTNLELQNADALNKIKNTTPTPNTSQGLGLAKIKNNKFSMPDVDGNAMSELARAMFIRNNNKNVDINVRPALLDNSVETPISVTGDLLTKSMFDARANNLRSSSRPTTSDAGLELARQLSINQQADQIKMQGDAVNAEALTRNKAMNQEMQQRFALGRNQTANQNIGNLIGAQESMRQLRNMKTASMNQPIDDFWKAQNYKSMYEEQQNKNVDQQIKSLELEQRLSPERNSLVAQMDGLYNQIDIASRAGNSAKVQELNDQLAELKKKDATLSLNIRRWQLESLKNPNLQIPENFSNLGQISRFANGGSIEKELLKEEGKNKRENIKQKNSLSRELAKNYTKWLSDKSDDDSKEKIATMKQINDIIKSALS